MKERAKGFEKIAATGDAQQLPPGTATGMASPTGRPTVRTALTCRPERRGCRARAPRSQAEHGAAWRWLVLDRRRRMGEGSAQGCPGVKATREALREPPHPVQSQVMVRQQWALALNRRNSPGDRDKAVKLLETLISTNGPDPETLGILGRIYKDRYRELKKSGSIMAVAALEEAIKAYARGFESDPRDYYPGVNAITLLVEKGDTTALAEADRLVPLVSFAVARRGGDASSDYWDLATVLELAAISNDWQAATSVLPKTLSQGLVDVRDDPQQLALTVGGSAAPGS
jgi:uncharacterized protein DUF4071